MSTPKHSEERLENNTRENHPTHGVGQVLAQQSRKEIIDP
jgi:hypothetical protein